MPHSIAMLLCVWSLVDDVTLSMSDVTRCLGTLLDSKTAGLCVWGGWGGENGGVFVLKKENNAYWDTIASLYDFCKLQYYVEVCVCVCVCVCAPQSTHSLAVFGIISLLCQLQHVL